MEKNKLLSIIEPDLFNSKSIKNKAVYNARRKDSDKKKKELGLLPKKKKKEECFCKMWGITYGDPDSDNQKSHMAINSDLFNVTIEKGGDGSFKFNVIPLKLLKRVSEKDSTLNCSNPSPLLPSSHFKTNQDLAYGHVTDSPRKLIKKENFQTQGPLRVKEEVL